MNYRDTTEKNGIVYTLFMTVLTAGIILGSVYLARGWDEMSGGVTGYINGFVSSLPQKEENFSVFRVSFTSCMIEAAIIFLAGFFRFGFAVTGALILRRGFITGFTCASFIKLYGVKGLAAMLPQMPSLLILIPAAVIFSAVSVSFSLNENKMQKKFIFSYIFFALFMLSIFCVASLAEGFLTTTFMRLLFPKIT